MPKTGYRKSNQHGRAETGFETRQTCSKFDVSGFRAFEDEDGRDLNPTVIVVIVYTAHSGKSLWDL